MIFNLYVLLVYLKEANAYILGYKYVHNMYVPEIHRSLDAFSVILTYILKTFFQGVCTYINMLSQVHISHKSGLCI